MANERLTVKNFGPIREADLDLRKVTVLIGEQASGKSVLAKLFCIINHLDFYSRKKSFQDFVKNYSINYLNEQTSIRYNSKKYSSHITKDGTGFGFSKEVNELVKAQKKVQPWLDSMFNGGQNNEPDPQIINSIQQVLSLKNVMRTTTTYIPAERLVVSLVSESPFSFIDSTLPQFLINFGTYFDYAKRLDNSTFTSDTLGVKITSEGHRIKISYKGVDTGFSESSTGLQTLTPLIVLLEHLSSTPDYKEGLINFIIEEPELNLYPTTQKKLVEYLIEKCTQGDNRLIITTHSPYILTALNNCIEASNVRKLHPESEAEVDKLVPRQYQIDYEDVMAYFVADGTAKPIMNEEYQIIDANALDDVSNELGHVFDSLLDLKYQNQE